MPPPSINQKPEQIARDRVDAKLAETGWQVQDKDKIDFSVGRGIAVREYQTDIGPVDYVLFVDRRAVGVIEAKPEDWGHKITTVEEQAEGYAAAKLKWVEKKQPLAFVYESTGVITRFTDGRDPKPRSREVFTFQRPETMAEWLSKPKSLRERLHDIPPLDPAGFRACQVKAICATYSGAFAFQKTLDSLKGSFEIAWNAGQRDRCRFPYSQSLFRVWFAPYRARARHS